MVQPAPEPATPPRPHRGNTVTGRRLVLEGFAGPGGWSTGLGMLDLPAHHAVTVRPVDAPAATITASGDNGNTRWVYRASNQAHAARRGPDHPAPTVVGGERVNKVELMPEESAQDPGASGVPVTVQDAAVLQSFPDGYRWCGSKSAQHRQVGDAVPPMLAAHVLAACLGVDVP